MQRVERFEACNMTAASGNGLFMLQYKTYCATPALNLDNQINYMFDSGHFSFILQGRIGYEGTHVPMFVLRLDLMKLGQT